MASSTTPTGTAPVARQVPGEISHKPVLALVLGWLVPGGGHLLLGMWVRGLLLFVSVVGMVVVGLALKGKVYAPNSGDVLDMLGFAGQLGLGVLFALAKMLDWGSAALTNTLSDYGTKFLVVAGLLNIISAVDAHSLASGRKASL